MASLAPLPKFAPGLPTVGWRPGYTTRVRPFDLDGNHWTGWRITDLTGAIVAEPKLEPGDLPTTATFVIPANVSWRRGNIWVRLDASARTAIREGRGYVLCEWQEVAKS